MFLFTIPYMHVNFPRIEKQKQNYSLSPVLNIGKFSAKQLRKLAVVLAVYESTCGNTFLATQKTGKCSNICQPD